MHLFLRTIAIIIHAFAYTIIMDQLQATTQTTYSHSSTFDILSLALATQTALNPNIQYNAALQLSLLQALNKQPKTINNHHVSNDTPPTNTFTKIISNIEQSSDQLHAPKELNKKNFVIREEKQLFIWPARGKKIVNYGDSVLGSEFKTDHVIIKTREKKITSAAEGTVIYAKWMSDLGLTVIVNHGKDCLTIYANCDRILVSEGDKVDSTKTIAMFVGDDEHELYFAVRKNGKPLNPTVLIANKLQPA